MAMESYASRNPDHVQADVLHQARQACYKHFDRNYCKNKRVQRLLDDRDSRGGPLSLPQPYTFKPSPS